MASVTVTDILSPVVGLVVGAGLATLKYALAQRARLHEDLWSRRLDPYRDVWALTSQFSRWPRQNPTIGDVVRLHEQFRRWFYGDGGILMSSRGRKRYEFVQEGLAALCQRSSDTEKCVAQADYDDMVAILSGFRAALTDDLESRRKRSMIWSGIDLLRDRKVRRDLDKRLNRLAYLEMLALVDGTWVEARAPTDDRGAVSTVHDGSFEEKRRRRWRQLLRRVEGAGTRDLRDHMRTWKDGPPVPEPGEREALVEAMRKDLKAKHRNDFTLSAQGPSADADSAVAATSRRHGRRNRSS